MLQDSSLTESRTSFPQPSVVSLECDLQWLESVCKLIPKLAIVTKGMSWYNWSKLSD